MLDDSKKTKAQLLDELQELRERVDKLESMNTTERKRAEEGATRFSRVLEGSLNEIYMFDAETLKFVEVNRGARENLGYSVEEFRALTPLDLKPDLTAESFAELLKPLRSGDQELVQFGSVNRRKDGSQYPVEVYLQLTTDESPVFVAIILDVTHRKQVEKALRESEERFRAIYEHAPVLIDAFDERGHCVLWNEHCRKIFGWTIEEINAQDDALALFYPDSAVRDEVKRTVTSDPDGHFREWHPTTKDGEELTTMWANFRLPDGLTFNLGYDITERKRAEQELRLSAEVMKNMSEGVCLLSSDGLIVLTNPRFDEIFGYEPGELIGKHTAILNAEAETTPRETADEILQDLEEHGVWTGQVHNIRKDKEVIWTRSSVSTFDHPDHGKVRVAVVEDITERKRFQDGLTQSESRQRAVLEAVQAAVVVHDSEGEIVLSNRAAKKLLDSYDQSIEGREVDDPAFRFLDEEGDELSGADLPVSRVLETHEPIMDLVMGVISPGSEKPVWLLCCAVPIVGVDGDPSHVVVASMDITERRQAENDRRRHEEQLHQTQRLETLGVLAGGIAHDFNNLLHIILNHADYALSSLTTNTPEYESLQEIHLAAKRASGVTRQMLVYAGKAPLSTETLNLSDIVKEMAQLLDVSRSKKAVVEYRLDEKPLHVDGDPSLLRQVIMNLLTNASEAIGDERGTIIIETGITEDAEGTWGQFDVHGELREGTYVYLKVSDSGCGMSDEVKRRLFEPFFTTKFAGRGLGMAATLGIIKSHKGAIFVDSEVDHGTTFTMLIPAVEDSAVPAIEETLAGDDWIGKGTVLVVDDEPSIRNTTRIFLEEKGFAVLVAENGRKALEVFQANKNEIACVLLDLTMPEMGGEEALVELRKIRENVPVVLVSGYDERELESRTARLGFDSFYKKPGNIGDLLEIVHALSTK
jgi:PAS domain S-box-containing protein